MFEVCVFEQVGRLVLVLQHHHRMLPLKARPGPCPTAGGLQGQSTGTGTKCRCTAFTQHHTASHSINRRAGVCQQLPGKLQDTRSDGQDTRSVGHEE